ncbi:2S sulfur-rich seed storage protein 2-like [Impatiens glandulifera]|uniref:2S sulfur-rich seed storage protein 2-like n=1 Tax=Impatiens glandulifera TaxID=253017 RepID=UPI001FB1570C|nr:2S sulfur-rich seed storage protein 2-like [Impatiens glandulifera]
MMKLTIVSALLVVVVLTMGEASTAFRTIIIEEETATGSNPRGMEDMCVDQLMSQQMLSQCQMCVEKMVHKSLMNPMRGEEECMDMCCQQLRSMDEECRCVGFKSAVRMQMQRVTSKRIDEKIMREAERMYSQCNLSPRTCHMRHRSA